MYFLDMVLEKVSLKKRCPLIRGAVNGSYDCISLLQHKR